MPVPDEKAPRAALSISQMVDNIVAVWILMCKYNVSYGSGQVGIVPRQWSKKKGFRFFFSACFFIGHLEVLGDWAAVQDRREGKNQQLHRHGRRFHRGQVSFSFFVVVVVVAGVGGGVVVVVVFCCVPGTCFARILLYNYHRVAL